MYRVIATFADSQDKYHVYGTGDEFPRPGITVDSGRITELAGFANKLNRPLIEHVEDREEQKQATETTAKPKRTRKSKTE